VKLMNRTCGTKITEISGLLTLNVLGMGRIIRHKFFHIFCNFIQVIAIFNLANVYLVGLQILNYKTVFFYYITMRLSEIFWNG
jgi:hypothetical protein